jgi:hypothetical protein
LVLVRRALAIARTRLAVRLGSATLCRTGLSVAATAQSYIGLHHSAPDASRLATADGIEILPVTAFLRELERQTLFP